MKFVCDKCNTRYSIADERVRGRVLKIRCKSCNHVITVREDAVPAPAAKHAPHSMQEALDESFGDAGDGGEHTVVSSGMPGMAGMASMPASQTSEIFDDGADEWYVSFDGDQEGPYPLEKACERVRTEQPRGKEVHCWRPGFFVWLPVDEVPEFSRALQPPKPKVAPPPLPPARPATGKVATAKREPTGPLRKEPKKEPTHPTAKPTVQKDPTGPRAALAIKDQPPAPAPVDSKPIPLPPPPEMPGSHGFGVPSAMGAQQPTRPEPRNAYRRPNDMGPTPALGVKSLIDAPAKKPALPSLGGTGKRPALPSLSETGKKPAIPEPARPPNGGDAVSPFVAALAASAGKSAPDSNAKIPDTGPVPLPPPPGDELPIGEASGLLNLSHLASSQTAQARPRGTVETFGGQTVTPPTNGTTPSVSSAHPVVVMAGPAPKSAAPWIKYAALGGVALSLLLGTALIYVLVRTPPVPVVPKVEVAEPKIKVDDHPIAMAVDPTVQQPAVPGDARRNPIKRPPSVAATKNHPPDARNPSSKPVVGGLDDDSPGGHALVVPNRNQAATHEVSQPAIAQVVNQNHRSLGLCYERVLKHDNSLKKAKLTAKVKVGMSGIVKSAVIADAEFVHTEIGICVAAAIKNWHFPPNSEEYETEIPLLLQAN